MQKVHYKENQMTNFQLRKHQLQAVEETEASLAFGSQEIIIDIPTGGGKSFIIADLANKLHGNIVILVTFTPLIDQIADHLDIIGVDYSILKAGRDSEFDENHRVQLVMAQTYYARLDKVDIQAHYIIADEYHVSYETKRTNAIKHKLNPEAIIGLSATPYSSKGFLLSNKADFVQPTDMKTLTQQDYLSPLKFFIPKWAESIDYSAVKSSGADYTGSGLDEIIGTPKHIGLIVESMNQMDSKTKKSLVFCSTIEHCDKVTDALKADGYFAESYHSKTPKKNQEAIMSAFKSNEPTYNPESTEKNLFTNKSTGKKVTHLVSVSKLSIGFDVKDIAMAVVLRPTKVRSLWVQIAGRAARTAPGKQFAEVLDLSQCTSLHGFPDDLYTPPPLTGDKEDDRQALISANNSLDLMQSVLDDGEPQQIDRELYELKVEELKRKEQQILESDYLKKKAEQLLKQKTQEEVRTEIYMELGKTLNASSSILNVITLGARMWTLWYGQPLSKKGKPYSFSPDWLAEDAIRTFDEYPSMQRKWLKAHKTRIKNILGKQGNYNGIKFFSKFLLDNHLADEGVVNNIREFMGTTTTTDKREPTQQEVQHFDITEADIPF